MENSPLSVELVKESLTGVEAIELENKFFPFFTQAEKMKETALAIVVTSADDALMIGRAREARLFLKNLRIDCEKTRKTLKEESLRKGKAIDGMANVIKYLITPLEEHLEAQEKFVERQEELRKLALKQERENAVLAVGGDPSFYNLTDMDDATFSNLTQQIIENAAMKKRAEEQARADRIERERKDAEERECMRVENEKLKVKLAKEKEKADAARKEAEEAELKLQQARTKAAAEKRSAEMAKKDVQMSFSNGPRAYCAGIVQLDGDDIPENAQKGDLFIFMRDTPENRHLQAELLRASL